MSLHASMQMGAARCWSLSSNCIMTTFFFILLQMRAGATCRTSANDWGAVVRKQVVTKHRASCTAVAPLQVCFARHDIDVCRIVPGVQCLLATHTGRNSMN